MHRKFLRKKKISKSVAKFYRINYLKSKPYYFTFSPDNNSF